METSIPFSGLYESMHSHNLDEMLGVSEDDYDMAGGEGEKTKEELDKFYNSIDWNKEQASYCRAYVENVAGLLKIPLTYKDMISPQEYNFTTDRIFCEIAESDVQRLKKRVQRGAMDKYVRDHFTSCDGFSSFYESDYSAWLKQIEPFDHNQIQSLIECVLIAENGERWEYDMMPEGI